MSLTTPNPYETILASHIAQLTGLVDGVSGRGQRVQFTQYSDTVNYANTFGNVDTTNGLAAKFQYGPAASPTTIATFAKAGIAFAVPFLPTSLGVGEAPAANTKLAVVNNAVTTDSVIADFSASLTAGSQDTATARFMMSQMVAGTGTLMRAIEAHTLRDSAAITPVGSWICELGLHSEVASASALDGIGLRIESGQFTPQITGAVRQGAALAVLGTAGWSHALFYQDTDGSTTLASIDQSGHFSTGNVVPRTNSTMQSGTGSLAWLVVNTDNISLTTHGTAAAPNINRFGVGTAGVYFPSSGAQVGLTVGSSDTAILTTTGLTLSKMLVLPQVATPTAPGSSLTGLYSKSGGGLYSRANGGAEKQHKAGGQAGSKAGISTVTTSSTSYVDLLDAAAGSAIAVTLTTTGGDLLCWFSGAFMHSDATRSIEVAFRLDSGGASYPFSIATAVANEPFIISGPAIFTGVSAGSHTVTMRWLTDAATASANGGQRYLIVHELPS